MGDNIKTLLKEIKIPKMAKVKQKFNNVKIDNIEETIREQLSQNKILSLVVPGQSIAITCGSRGINNIALILREIVRNIKRLGAKPFIIPAMGSHGGSTAEGQKEVLSSYGVTEEYIGAPIKATMDVQLVGYTDSKEPVYIDKYAYNADGIIVVNRIKTHTAFKGKYESGLMKMITIGLGKQAGANACHMHGFKYMAEKIPKYANVILNNTNILFGVGILENPYEETYKIISLTNEEIPLREPDLLLESKTLLPKLKFDKFDILIVDEIGKEISGAGMDTNIVGRFATPYASGGPTVQRIIVLDLTKKSHGNATGIGLADITTRRMFDKIIFANTYPNCLTNTLLEPVKIPVVMENDNLAIRAAIKTCTFIDKENPRIIRIKNTLNIDEIYISEVLLDKVKGDTDIEILEEPKEMIFDNNDNLF